MIVKEFVDDLFSHVLFYLSVDEISFDNSLPNIVDLNSVNLVSEKGDSTEEGVKKIISMTKSSWCSKWFKRWKMPFKFIKFKR